VQWAQTYSTTEPDVEPENFDDEFEDESFNSTASAYTCNICHSDFGSNNKLHTHIRAHSEDDSVQAEVYIATPTDLPLIESTASQEGASAVTEIATGIVKNYLKAFAVLSSDSYENTFWRDHG
jgi:hypothetical protein